MDFLFLSVADVKREQLDQLALYGGGEPGVLSETRLDSAVNAPRQTFEGRYLLKDVFEMAAGYLEYLLMGHAFGNGNKRVSLATALEFLFINGYMIEFDAMEMAQVVLDLAEHKIDSQKVAQLFRTNQQPMNFVLAGLTADERLGMASQWMHKAYAPAFRKLAE
jgi:death on curing protein